MRGFSKAIIAGNLTRDPELRTTTTGSNVCGFGIAVNRRYNDASGNSREETSFFDCSAWGRTGEIINQYAKRGNAILVSGRLSQRSWDDKATGAKRSRVEIVVEDFTFLGGREGGAANSETYVSETVVESDASSAKPAAAAKGSAEPEVVPDDIPEGEISLDEVPF